MLGQIPAYASYIALGCGAAPKTEISKIPTSYSISGSTVTVTISGGHTFKAGDNIVVQMNDSRVDGDKTIATATSTQLTFPANYTITALTAVNDAFPGTGYAEYTSASAHRLIVGDLVTTTGFTDTDFNNTNVAVYAIASSTTFIIAEAGTGTTSSGTLSTITPTVQAGAIISIDYSAKRSLDFEMVRVPITSRGLSIEDTIDTLVFGAESPTQDRLSVTEIGIYSAGTNNLSVGSQSNILHTFANYENWELHSLTSSAVSDYIGVLGKDQTGAVLALTSTDIAKFISSDDAIFENANRTTLLEKPRMYDSTLIVSGNMSSIDNIATSASAMTIGTDIVSGVPDYRHIHLLGQSYNFNQNSSSDEIRIAFSVLYKTVQTITNPDYLGIIVEFSSETETVNPKYARMKIRKTSADLASTHYFVETVSLANLEMSANFSWSAVDTVKIFCTALSGGSPSSNYYVALDAIRFQNVYDEDKNSSYGMSAYSVVGTTKTISATDYIVPIEKSLNNSSLIEYKFPITVSDI